MAASAALGLGLSLLAAPARGGACEPVRLTMEGAEPSAAWRAAYDEILAATSAEGHLWSCAAGELYVVIAPDGGSATLRRRDPRGREAVRRVPDPGDLVPMAEALLALSGAPGAGRPSTEPPPRPASSGPVEALPPAPAKPVSQEPRVMTEALFSVRRSGVLRSVWGAGTLRVAVPLDAWSVGAWVRYALPYVLDLAPVEFSMSDVAFGLTLGRRLAVAGPLELHATFDPSIGLVSMEGGSGPNPPEGAKVDPRLGLGLRTVLRWTQMWRGVFALDAELAPGSAAMARRIRPTLPPLPAYSVGASFGVSVAFR